MGLNNMSKYIKIILVLIIILIVIILLITIYKKLSSNKETDINRLIKIEKTYDKLLEVGYNESGNSLGNVYRVTINVDNKILKLEEKEEHSLPLSIKEYKVSDKDLNILLKDIDKYNLPEWKCLEYDTELIELDGPSRSIFFVYDNSKINYHGKEWYTVKLNSKVSDKGHEVLYNFRKKIIELIKDENLVKEYVKEEE